MIFLIKIIVLDFDGAILNSEEKISEKSKNYLRKLKDMGYIVVIATGRIYESVNYAINGFDTVNYVIIDTGVSCYDASDRHTIFNHCKKISHISVDIETNEQVIELYSKLKKRYA